jgi:glyoxylase-like metal-dependent hydrolase (beta-lactamase superfamily II)
MNIDPKIILEQIEIGPMANFAYLIGDAGTKQVSVVDPGWDPNLLFESANKNNYKIESILLTHGHYDHVQATEELLALANVPVYISKADSEFFDIDMPGMIKLEDGDRIKVGGIGLDCILTPGHTPGCMCFYYRYPENNGGVLLTGDVLFIGACGRCDLPGSDPAEMYDSLYGKLMSLPDDTLIFSGHAYGRRPYDTLGHQKEVNRFLKYKDREEFLADW